LFCLLNQQPHNLLFHAQIDVHFTFEKLIIIVWLKIVYMNNINSKSFTSTLSKQFTKSKSSSRLLPQLLPLTLSYLPEPSSSYILF
jgi:hypothetical protein